MSGSLFVTNILSMIQEDQKGYVSFNFPVRDATTGGEVDGRGSERDDARSRHRRPGETIVEWYGSPGILTPC